MSGAVKNQPATPLPWRVKPRDTSLTLLDGAGKRAGQLLCVGDVYYAAHAANAYPKLVEALRGALLMWEKPNATHTPTYRKNYERLAGLLRELGEES